MKDKPNILLISADQMRWDCLGCAGNPVIQTPNLDALAARGIRFANAFTPNPICVPARASIMTGNYPQICTGVKANAGKIKEGQPLLTEVLKSVGYRAYAAGKLHFVPYSPPGEPRLVHGFEHVDLTESGRILAQFDPEGKLSGLEDYFDYLKSVGWNGFTRAHGVGNNDVRPCPSPLPAEHYVDHWVADRTMKRIDAHLAESPDQPFFMWMSSPKPHSPYDPPRPYDKMYDSREVPTPFGSTEHLLNRNPFLDYMRYTHGIPSLSPEAWQVIRSYYYGNVTFLDAMIGRVIAHLEQRELLDSTLIIFTADHGDMLGDFGSCFKCTHQNGSVRVPLLFAGPGVKPGGVADGFAGLQDLLPTLTARAGANIGHPVQGLDVSPLLANPGASVRDCYYASTGEPGQQSVMVTWRNWKYIYSEWGAMEELYDAEQDPDELDNLAHSVAHADVREESRKHLRQCVKQFDDGKVLAGNDFVSTQLDRSAFIRLAPTAVGWRWY